jgi:oxygen-dependent protoporphyrinogen oxidase
MPKVIVIGAGIAGLGAAYRLQQGGVDVSVLEAEDEPGGRMRSRQWQGVWCDIGAGEIADSFRELLAVCDELGLERIPHHGDEHLTMNVYKNGETYSLRGFDPRGLLRFRAMSVLDRLRLVKIFPTMLRQLRRSRGSHFEPWRAAWCDDTSVEAWLSRLSRGFLEYAMEPLFEGQATWSPHQIGRGAFAYLMTESMSPDLYTFPEGLGQVTRALARKLDVSTGARVQRVKAGSAPVVEYKIDGRERSDTADAVVVAVPGSRVDGLVDGLDDERRYFFRHVTYVPLQGVMFKLSRPPEGVGTYVYFPRREDIDIARIGYGPAVTDPSQHFFHVLMKQGFLSRNRHLGDDEMVTRVRETVARRYPQVDPLVEDVWLTRWREGLPIFPTGYVRALDRLRRLPPAPGLAFAGDYLCGPATGFAFVSGQRAADDLLARLR